MARKRKNRQKIHRKVVRSKIRPKKRKSRKPKARLPSTRKTVRRAAAKSKTTHQGKRKPRRQSSARHKRSPKASLSRLEPSVEIAVRDINRGKSVTAAARDSQIHRKRLQSILTQHRLAKHKGRRWVVNDNRPRRVPVMTGGRFRVLTVRGYKEARLVGAHHNAVGEFVRTNNIKLIQPFDGAKVQAISGRKYPLESDPNALHRIAAMDTPPFHEIYEITSGS